MHFINAQNAKRYDSNNNTIYNTYSGTAQNATVISYVT